MLNYIAICSTCSALLPKFIPTLSVLIYLFELYPYTTLSRSPCPFFLHPFIPSIYASVIFSFSLLFYLLSLFNLLSYENLHTFVVRWRFYTHLNRIVFASVFGFAMRPNSRPVKILSLKIKPPPMLIPCLLPVIYPSHLSLLLQKLPLLTCQNSISHTLFACYFYYPILFIT